MPYRPGALTHNFVAKGRIDLTWSTDGQCYRSALLIDPHSGRTEGTLYAINGDDVTMIAGPLIRDYRRSVHAIVGPTELLLAAMYSVQTGVGAFLRLPRPERKALLGELLGLQRFTQYQATAKAHGAGAEVLLATTRQRITDLAAIAARRPLIEQQRATAEQESQRARDLANGARAALEIARTDLIKAREARAAVAPLSDELGRLDVEMAGFVSRIGAIEKERASDVKLVAMGREIRAAVERTAVIRGEVENLTAEIDKATAAFTEQSKLRAQAEIAASHAGAKARETTKEYEQLRRQVSVLGTVPCRGEGNYATCQYLKDAQAATPKLPAAKEASRLAIEALDALPPVPSPTTDMVKPLVARRTMLQQEAARYRSAAEQQPALSAAHARIDASAEERKRIDADLATKTARRGELKERLADLAQLDENVAFATKGVEIEEGLLNRYAFSIESFAETLGGLRAQLDKVDEADRLLVDLRAREAVHTDDVADWALLGRAFGPSGIPALLIDQALPELGRLATDLLTTCFGEQVFTISLTTQRASADGDRQLETLDVIVRRGGEPIDAALLSGGESVLVSEALSLALALYTASRSGRQIRTLLRDEVSAPLDVARAPAYVRMLRRSAQLGGFRHVLYVSHQAQAIELADAQLEVRAGTVTLS
jgi:exonuclease SbcC